AGPALTALGVTNALPDPRLELFSGATSVLNNNDWANATAVSSLGTQVGAFPFPASSRDAALVANAVGGSYTAFLASADAGAGVALAEIYDGSAVFSPTTPRLINVSARTEVGTEGNLLIAGFVVSGHAAKLVLIRGIGPALAQFRVLGALPDPRLTLFRDAAPIAANDNWHDAPNAVAIAETSTLVGAFSLAPDSADAALLLTLPPGSYTAQLAAAPGTNPGTGLVEVYDVP
ncbi:MAG: hypothetical protein V4773_10125, partial [Verrucomicrobiota bacterium]